MYSTISLRFIRHTRSTPLHPASVYFLLQLRTSFASGIHRAYVSYDCVSCAGRTIFEHLMFRMYSDGGIMASMGGGPSICTEISLDQKRGCNGDVEL